MPLCHREPPRLPDTPLHHSSARRHGGLSVGPPQLLARGAGTQSCSGSRTFPVKSCSALRPAHREYLDSARGHLAGRSVGPSGSAPPPARPVPASPATFLSKSARPRPGHGEVPDPSGGTFGHITGQCSSEGSGSRKTRENRGTGAAAGDGGEDLSAAGGPGSGSVTSDPGTLAEELGVRWGRWSG